MNTNQDVVVGICIALEAILPPNTKYNITYGTDYTLWMEELRDNLSVRVTRRYPPTETGIQALFTEAKNLLEEDRLFQIYSLGLDND